MLAAPPSWVPWPRRAGLRAACALLLVCFGLQFLIPEPFAYLGVAYVVCVVLAARGHDRGRGLAVAGLALALMVAWTQIKDSDLGPGHYVTWGLAFVAVALLAATGSVRADDGRERSEARRREELELAGVATWELDVASGEMRWSDAYQALYGVDPRARLTTREAFRQIVAPTDRKLVTEAIDRVVEDRVTVEVRYRIIRPSDGAERVLRTHIRVLGQPGDPLRLIGTAQDVTDLVRVLTPRESEMLMLLAEGLSGEQIADRLVLSRATVRTHIQNAMVKLGVHTRGEAIASAIRSGEIGS